MTNPLAGVFELVDDDDEGYAVVTDTHYSVLIVKKNRAPWNVGPAKVTEEMHLEAWRGLRVAQVGAYEIVSSDGPEHEAIMHPLAARVPRAMPDVTEKFVVEGDRLINTAASGKVFVWQKVR